MTENFQETYPKLSKGEMLKHTILTAYRGPHASEQALVRWSVCETFSLHNFPTSRWGAGSNNFCKKRQSGPLYTAIYQVTQRAGFELELSQAFLLTRTTTFIAFHVCKHVQRHEFV